MVLGRALTQEEFKYKQVIVVRSDLKMSKGKLAVQVAHASVTCVVEAVKRGGEWEEWLWKWVAEGQKKVVVKVGSLEELRRIYEKALRENMPSSFIVDAGKTELEPGTPTCVGIGPAPASRVDKITGMLSLL